MLQTPGPEALAGGIPVWSCIKHESPFPRINIRPTQENTAHPSWSPREETDPAAGSALQVFPSLFHLPEGCSLTCGVGPVRMGHGRAQGPRAELVVQEAAGWRGEAAGVEMVVRGVEGMDGMSTNHSCG